MMSFPCPSKQSSENSSFSFTFSKTGTDGKPYTRTHTSGYAHQCTDGDMTYFKLDKSGKYIPADQETYNKIKSKHNTLRLSFPGHEWFESESLPVNELINIHVENNLLESILQVQKENNELRNKFFKNRDKRKLCKKCLKDY